MKLGIFYASIQPSTRPRFMFVFRALSGRLKAIAGHFEKLRAAYNCQRQDRDVPESAVEDTALDREAITGVQQWQPELPFFMQSGFEKRP